MQIKKKLLSKEVTLSMSEIEGFNAHPHLWNAALFFLKGKKFKVKKEKKTFKFPKFSLKKKNATEEN